MSTPSKKEILLIEWTLNKFKNHPIVELKKARCEIFSKRSIAGWMRKCMIIGINKLIKNNNAA